jgi:hypothetical protein
MNLNHFFEHWSVTENPFRGEEARHDAVFARMTHEAVGSAASIASMHSDFEKILGELARPSTSIVFGEKGSGKTAIRLQIADRIAAHNAEHPDARVMLIAYDDLNSMLDRFHRHVGGKSPLDSFEQMRLTDHIDAIIAEAVGSMTDQLLGSRPGGSDIGVAPGRALRKLDRDLRWDLLLLQVIHDEGHPGESAEQRTPRLRRMLRLAPPRWSMLLGFLSAVGWTPGVALYIWSTFFAEKPVLGAEYISILLVLLWVAVLLRAMVWNPLTLRRLGHRLRKQIRVSARDDASYARALAQLPARLRASIDLPVTDSDDQRYAMLDRLRRVIAGFGCTGMLVVVDRVDEPTLVNGDPRAMRAIVWPLLNNKFLQQEGLGVKMLLPAELRHALFQESSSFFQEARLDKQHLVERLGWTGAMLYDLCDARLAACRPSEAEPITLLDLFAEDVTQRDLIDALDQMHQPRDAFKLLYRCLAEHCSNVTREQAEWRIPRLVLDAARKTEVERLQQLYRGIRPA